MAVSNLWGAFANQKIGTRISVAVLLPLAGTLWLAASAVEEQWLRVGTMHSLHGIGEVATAYSAVIHELQKERGTSAGFLGSAGTKFADRLAAQRQATDQRREAMINVRAGFDPVLRAAALDDGIGRGDKGLAELEDRRRRIGALAVTTPEAIRDYTQTIAALIDVIANMAASSTDRDVSNAIGAYVALIKAKERAGQERATGSAAFSAGKFTVPLYQRFIELVGEQNGFMDQFFVYATPGMAAHYRDRMRGNAIDEHVRLRGIALASMETGDLAGIESTHWFDTITARIDRLKEVEDAVAQDIDALASRLGEEAKAQFATLAAMMGVLVLLTVATALLIVRDIVRSLAGMTGAMAALADRRLDIEVPGEGRRDEIGTMAAAMAIFKNSMIEAEHLEAEQERQRQVRDAHAERLEELTARFEMTASAVVGRAMDGAGRIGDVAGRLGSGVGKTGAQSLEVAEVTERTVDNVGAMAHMVDRLSESIHAITGQVERSLSVANNAVAEAGRANGIVFGLAEAVQKIGSVVRLITDIASQTNLLALNATVEAARAGEAGKGFAVVANQVKQLANQTAKATDDIIGQISNLQDVSQEAVAAIDGITSIINGVSQVASDIVQSVEQQRSATEEIARSTQALATDAQSVQASVTTMTQSSAMSHALAVEVIWAASDLGDWLNPFGNEMTWFIKQMKAA